MSTTLKSLPEVLTIVQVAEYLHLNPRTVAKMLRTGTLKGRLDIQKWVITKRALEEYLAGKEEK